MVFSIVHDIAEILDCYLSVPFERIWHSCLCGPVDIAYVGLVFPKKLNRDMMAENLQEVTGCPWIYPRDASSMMSVPSTFGSTFVEDASIYETYNSFRFMSRKSFDKLNNREMFRKELRSLEHVFLQEGTRWWPVCTFF